MDIKQAKEIVKQAFNAYTGFDSVLPEDLLFSFAGSVKHLGWTVEDLNNAFKSHFSQELVLINGKEVKF